MQWYQYGAFHFSNSWYQYCVKDFIQILLIFLYFSHSDYINVFLSFFNLDYINVFLYFFHSDDEVEATRKKMKEAIDNIKEKSRIAVDKSNIDLQNMKEVSRGRYSSRGQNMPILTG